MEFLDEIKVLGSRSQNLGPQLKTEEATKTSLVLPFIQLLGYNIFDPTEVIPEFQAEAGVKKGSTCGLCITKRWACNHFD